MEIVEINEATLERYLLHLERQIAESGEDGLPIFVPFALGDKPRAEDLAAGRGDGMLRSTSEPGWRRMWGAQDDDVIVGHAELGAGGLVSELHRAALMLGLERSHYGRGLASQLTNAAIEWARRQPSIQWLDLTVFATNAPAITLYERLGFVRVGMLEDRFRVDGHRIDDVLMTLRLADAQ